MLTVSLCTAMFCAALQAANTSYTLGPGPWKITVMGYSAISCSAQEQAVVSVDGRTVDISCKK
jgi:hypothetical protein